MHIALRWGVLSAALACVTAGAVSEVQAQSDHQMFVHVRNAGDWSPVPDATVCAETTDGTYAEKAICLPSGVHYVSTVIGDKTVLELEHPVYGTYTAELTLPSQPFVWVNAVFNGYGDATVWVPGVSRMGLNNNGGIGSQGPPANDLCADAIAIGVGLTAGTTVGATLDDDISTNCGTSITAPGVWYSVIGSGNTMSASTCTDLAGYDTKLSIFCRGCDNALCVGGNDDNCTTGASVLLSTVEWCSQAGTEYLVLVHGFSDGTGEFELVIGDDGVACDGAENCRIEGACCLGDGTCVDGLTQDECEGRGGTYEGDGTSCSGAFTGYSIEDCDSAFEDISATGNAGPTGDDSGLLVPLGFTFNFYGEDKTDITISTNGYLTFGSDGTDFSNDACPDSFDPNDAIFALWDDFNLNDGGAITYQTLGTAPNQRFIAQWTDVAEFDTGGANTATFQAVLYEGSNEIEIRIDSLNGAPSDGAGDATIGVENADGSDAACIDDTTIFEGQCIAVSPQFENAPDCEPAECFIILGDGSGSYDWTAGGHVFSTQLSNVADFRPTLLTDIPLFPLTFEQQSYEIYAQLLMWNPIAFPENPEQFSEGMQVTVWPDGSITGNTYGVRDGIDIFVEQVSQGGEDFVRFPFAIDGME